MPHLPRVALLIDISSSCRAWIVPGMAPNAEQRGPWLFDLKLHGKNDLLRPAEAGRVNSAIARVNNASQAEQIVRNGLPVVNAS